MKIDRRDPFGAELRRLIDQLDQRQFKALSNGVGLGRARTSTVQPRYTGKQPTSFSEPIPFTTDDHQHRDESNQQNPLFEPISFSSGAGEDQTQTTPDPSWMPHRSEFMDPNLSQMGGEAPQGLTQIPKQRLLGRLLRIGFEHSIDLITVLATLFVTLTGAAFLLAPWKGAMGVTLSQWQPVQVILTLGLLQFVCVVYVLYFLYWIVFKLFVGSTFGQNCGGLFFRVFSRSRSKPL